MKRLRFLSVMCLLLINYVTTYAQESVMENTQIQKNITADKVLLKVFETGNVTLLDDIISPDFINHTASGDRVGIENLKTMVQGFHDTFKPTKIELLRQLSDDEYVADWVRFCNQSSVIEGIEMTKFKDGRAVEHWFFPNSQKGEIIR
ncbi:MAG: nuclear transport factor 2 family protein [Cytophagales bacterium]|nr:nuclear transport factor 2 family protein [Cytophagales bacterium]